MKALLSALRRPPEVPSIATVSPLDGLARRGLGAVDAVAQSVAAVAPTAGMATMPALVAAGAGRGTAAAVLLATVIVVLISSTISQFARRLAVAGSLYSYAAQAVRPYPAFLTGVTLLAGYAFIAMFALAGAGMYMADLAARFVPPGAVPGWATAAGVVAVGAFCFAVMRRGIRVSSRATLALECGSVLLVLALVALLLVRQGGPSWQVFSLAGASPAGIAGGSVMALMAFVGFESATVLGAETRSPLKTLPRALLWTALSTGVFYLLTAYTQLAGFEQLGLPLAGSNAPFVDLAVAGEAPGLLVALDAAIALSFVACALASATALVRVLFTMGREGVLPSWAGQAHPKFKTPHRAIGASLPMVVAGPLVFLAAGFTPWAAMNALVTCAAAGFVTAYILTCIALPLFLRRIGEVTARPVVLALLAAALLSGTLVVYIGEAFRGPQGTGGWIFLSIVAVASLWYGWKRRADPGLSRRLGIYDEPTREDLLRPAGDS